ncbi:MAG: hypothetical protein K2X35_09360 [Bryobacteraceae bacterium]|nr:hypothetical protein [Bryobacteraceae bacterium]
MIRISRAALQDPQRGFRRRQIHGIRIQPVLGRHHVGELDAVILAAPDCVVRKPSKYPRPFATRMEMPPGQFHRKKLDGILTEAARSARRP